MNERVIRVLVTLGSAALVAVTADGAGRRIQKEEPMTARGTFDVKVTPEPRADNAGGPFDRLLLAKQFHGDLQGTSTGQMLATTVGVDQSGGYVALEQVSGVLHGKRGSFILQHKGSMRKGAFSIDVTVVPDSGTNELTGIKGAMAIQIEGPNHSYEFRYTLGKD